MKKLLLFLPAVYDAEKTCNDEDKKIECEGLSFIKRNYPRLIIGLLITVIFTQPS